MTKNKRTRKSRTSRFVAILIIVFIFFNMRAFGISDKEIVDKGLLPLLNEYRTTFKLGKVISKTAINHIEDEEKRRIQAQELAIARKTLNDFKLLFTHLRNSNVSVENKIHVFLGLHDLKTKVSNDHKAGVGNIQLRCMLSMLISGIFFDLYSDLDESQMIAVSKVFKKNSGAISIDSFEQMLKEEMFKVPEARNEATLYDLIMKVSSLEGGSKAQAGQTHAADLDMLAKKLQSKISESTFDHQFDKLDVQWLAWDILWATRLEALCRLCKSIPVAQGNKEEHPVQRFKAFQSAISNKLSVVEMQAINAKFRRTSSEIQKDAYILLEIQEHISDKGCRILDMVNHRMKNIK